MRSFTVANEATLVERIQAATDRVIYVAPGLFMGTAESILERLNEGTLRELKVVIDADDEVCRIGYGEIEAVRKLQDASVRPDFMLCHQPGLRIGALLTDDDLLVWSPAPLLVEEESHEEEKPNAIHLSGGALDAFCEAVGSSEYDGEPDVLKQELGLDPLPEERLKASEKSLEEIPPKKFSLARPAMVFSSKLEYVEMKLNGYQMSKKVMPIPADLLILSNDRKIRERWHNRFALFDNHEWGVEIAYRGETLKVNEPFLDAERKRLEEKYLITIPGYGKVIPIKLKQKFLAEVENFEKMLKEYAEHVDEMVKDYLIKEIQKLTDDLLPRFLENPPAEFQKTLLLFDGSEKQSAHSYITGKLKKAAGTIQQSLHPKIRVVSKGITYDTFMNKAFVEHLNRIFGDDAVGQILHEFDAAPEVEPVRG